MNMRNLESDSTPSYWMEVPPVVGKVQKPNEGGIVVIGSGLSGASTAYWLLEAGFDKVTIVDFETPKAATFRNCGHILYGTVESMKALSALHGKETAREVWQFSIDICHEVRETISRLGLECEYRQDGYLVIAIDDVEDNEIKESISLLGSMGFQSEYVSRTALANLGFRNITGARYEHGSAQAHPVKFRNGLLNHCISRGVEYFSGVKVSSVEGASEGVELETNWGKLRFDAAVICANAYSPLLSRYFAERQLVDPFRGQIITSKPLRQKFKVTYPHSFDHGYEYAIVTADNRLMIGGWRNRTEGGEVGTYEIIPNPLVEEGLRDFVKQHYDISENLEWEYSWAGIMAASKTGFPFIGPTSHPLVYTCAGYTGHGFSWAHGSAKLLVDIIAGNALPAVSRFFTPARI